MASANERPAEIRLGHVVRSHKLMNRDLHATLTVAAAFEYKLEVTKSLGGFETVVKRASITANSNRLAILKMKRWLDVRYPVKTTSLEKDSARANLEALFA